MRQTTRCKITFLALLALLMLTRAAAAQDKDASSKPLERKALDESIYQSLRTLIDRGADLYNQGDWNGCYRLWEGALMGIKPMLDHRPKLQEAIDGGLSKARVDTVVWQRAWALRPVLDKIRADINADYPHKRKREEGETPLTKDETKKPVEKKSAEKKEGKKADDKTSVAGRITFKGKPLAGGTIILTGETGKAEGTIAADGSYKIEGVKRGDYTVSFKEVKGAAIPAAYGDSKKSPLRLRMNGGKQNFDISLQ